jgi:CrcB protein
MNSLTMRYLCVMGGGAAGSLLRYTLAELLVARVPSRFPLATFLINITGSFLIGLVLGSIGDRDAVNLRALLVAGFLGGYTTFSAFEWELLRLGRTGLAVAYGAGSVVVGLGCCWAGAMLAGRQ